MLRASWEYYWPQGKHLSCNCKYFRRNSSNSVWKHQKQSFVCNSPNGGHFKNFLNQSTLVIISFDLYFRSLKLIYFWLRYDHFKSVLLFQHPVLDEQHRRALWRTIEITSRLERFQKWQKKGGFGWVKHLVPHLDLKPFLRLGDALGDSVVIHLISVNHTVSTIIKCIRNKKLSGRTNFTLESISFSNWSIWSKVNGCSSLQLSLWCPCLTLRV